MIIKTKVTNYNREISVNIEGEPFNIIFDASGECVIEDEKGKILVEKYVGILWESKNEPEAPKTPEEKITEGFVKELNEKISQLEESVKNRTHEKKAAEADLEVWKKKCQELIDSEKGKEDAHKEKIKEYEYHLKKARLEIGLWKSNMDEIKKLCEDSGYKKIDYEKHTKKEDLIGFILKKDK
jgi:hypothetical protein